MSSLLNQDLDRRIIAALQVDGRAPWSTIAAALGEQERTVARRGADLLAAGAVRVTGLSAPGDPVLVRLRCAPGTAQLAARSLAGRADTTFTYLLTGTSTCCAELFCAPTALSTVLLEELPAIPGVIECESMPVLRYLRAVHEWQPFDRSSRTLAAMDGKQLGSTSDPQPVADSATDRAIVHLLRENGRATHEELGRVAGVSASTARRRVAALRGNRTVLIRSVVNPALLGLAVQAMLWIRAPAGQVERAAEALQASPYVRYAAVVGGQYQLAAEIAAKDRPELHDLVTRAPWLEHVDTVETSLVLRALKSSGVPMPPPVEHDVHSAQRSQAR